MLLTIPRASTNAVYATGIGFVSRLGRVSRLLAPRAAECADSIRAGSKDLILKDAIAVLAALR